MTRVRTILPALATIALAGFGPGAATPANATPAAAAPAAALAAASDLESADRIMNLGYRDFMRHPRIAPFDWETNGCTWVGPPARQMFHDACVQHDFGYGNYGAKGRLKLDPTSGRRAWIDERLWHEMRNICHDHYTGILQPGCLTSAKIVYDGVRELGKDYFF
ncbi:phospholipase A2 [Streptomyces sp. NPDC002701]|uniref:phospholipase A2 n=1 Tax=Streptomyces sp. NPDC002701 TaxID=3364661 RepID=UPI0036A51BE0